MLLRKTILLSFLLIIFCLYKPQALTRSEAEINNKYDQIEETDLKFNDLNQINTLYNYSQNKGYKSGILRGLIALQKHYLTKGKYTLSQQYGEKAEIIAKELNDYKALATINTCMGNSFTILGLQKDALMSLNSAMKYNKKIENIIDRKINQAYISANYAGYYEGKRLNDSIFYYVKKGLSDIESVPNRHLTSLQKSKYYYMMIFQNMNMGNFYVYAFQSANLDKAEPYFLKVISFSKSYPQYFTTIAIDAYDSISMFYLLKKDYKKAIEYSEKVLASERKTNSPQSRLNAYENLKTSYEAIGDLAQQNKYLKLYTNLNDSILMIKKQSVILHTENKINQSKREINSLKKYTILLSIIALVILSSLLFYFYRKNIIQKKKYHSLIAQLSMDTTNLTNTSSPILPSDDYITNNILSPEKEKEIINRLNAFETSEKFLKKNITLSFLSYQLDTNSKYLSQIINQYKKQNFNSYINHLRINYILHKLHKDPLYREYKISYLATECGYASSQVFIHAFKKETGMTPSYFIYNLKQQNPEELTLL
ncbi:helix-turn-helix domain-containing protein [Elizabethkingia anophelis]|nr:helix-turn-helix domain-containing protein [Elizabethkingia anophelis]